MKIIVPQYYGQFRCLASDCPDTCCAGWEVVLDKEALEQYEQLEGKNTELYTHIAQAQRQDGDDWIFQLESDGRCPFLNRQNLCDIQDALGEKGLCRTCHLYPRFITDFGGVREMGLSLSCPEAARIILSHKGKIIFESHDDPSIPPSLNELDAEQYFAVRQIRESLLKLAQASPLPVDERCALMLRLARKGQKKLKKRKYSAVQKLCERFDPHLMMGELRLCYQRCAETDPTPYALFPETLLTLSILRPAWKDRLEKEAQTLVLEPLTYIHPLDPEFEQQLLTTFVYRYVMRAASDGSLSALTKLCIFSMLAVRVLGQGYDIPQLTGLVHLYSREIEHDEDNIAALLTRFESDKLFSGKRFTKLLMQDYPQPLHLYNQALL